MINFLQRLLVNPTNHPLVQMIRYGLVVAIAGPVDLGGYILLKSQADLHPVPAATISFTVSMAVNYALSVAWVFNRHTGRQKRIDMTLFAVIGFVGLAITDLVILILNEGFEVNYIVSKLVAFVIVFFWSFGARRALFHNPLLLNKLLGGRFTPPDKPSN